LVRTEKRFVLDTPEADEGIALTVPSSLYPDVGVVVAADESHRGGVALEPPPLQLETVLPEKVPQGYVEIRDTAARRLVTVIELLSPANKHGEGHQQYILRRSVLLTSTSHLMEIDLLRGGQRVPMQKPLPHYPYFVLLSRVEKRPLVDVWPVRLSQRLPTVSVPLLPGDDDVPLNLQRALNQVYEQMRYDLSMDYAHPPSIPFDVEEAAWAREGIDTWLSRLEKT
jgi:hypothetical protein